MGVVPIGDGTYSRWHWDSGMEIPPSWECSQASHGKPRSVLASPEPLGDIWVTPKPPRAVTHPLPPQGTDLKTTSGSIPTVRLCLRLLHSEVRTLGLVNTEARRDRDGAGGGDLGLSPSPGCRQGIGVRLFTISMRRRARLVKYSDKWPTGSILQHLWSSGMSQQGGNLAAWPWLQDQHLGRSGCGREPDQSNYCSRQPTAPICKAKSYPSSEFGRGLDAVKAACPPSPGGLGPAGGGLWSDCPGGSAKRGLCVMNYSHGCH